MRVTAGDDGEVYEWLEDWADVPSPDEASIGWAHPGIAVTGAGEVVSFHPERCDVMIFGAQGQFLRSWPTRTEGRPWHHAGQRKRPRDDLGSRPGQENAQGRGRRL